jgi:hypothetical protein
MSNNECYQLPLDIYERDGPFSEFKQDGSIVTVELNDGKVFSGVVVLYPNYIISIKDHQSLPFDPKSIIKIYQTETDLNTRSKSNWVWFSHP